MTHRPTPRLALAACWLLALASGALAAATTDLAVTQSTSPTIVGGNSVSCNSGGFHTDNSYYRSFPLAAFPAITGPFTVTSVDVGIEVADDGAGAGQPMTVTLYRSSVDPPTLATLSAPVGTANVTVSDQGLAILSVPVRGVFLPTDVLVVEVFTPDGTAVNNRFLIGSNNLGQARPSYIRTAPCGVVDITDLAAVGFPSMHMIMQVNGWVSTLPPAPTSCVAATGTVSDMTPVSIPDSGTVTSTITVSGMSPYLYDLNVLTWIRHTSSGDLDVTLTSPAGTTVTLTTDNGGGNDDVFDGTLWDDGADPGGQVPYASNDGLVTDQPYVNGTTATPLVPEEALGAFIGENPNGTWTLSVGDDLGGETGTLDGWALQITALPGVPFLTSLPFTSTTPLAIPTGPGVVSTMMNVSGLGAHLLDLDLVTSLRHTFAADLDITLTSPAGTVVTLTSDNGGSTDDVFDGTLWDDNANPGGVVPYTSNTGLVTDRIYTNLVAATPLVPEEAFGAFVGENPNGDWTITVSDDLAGDGGSLDDWTLYVTTASCEQPTTTTSTTTTTTATTSTTPSTSTSTSTTASTATIPSTTTTSTTTTSSSTTTTTLPSCTHAATYESILCRLAEIHDDVQENVPPGAVAARLVAALASARGLTEQAEVLGDPTKARKPLTKASRALGGFVKRLRSRKAATIDQAVRDALGAAAMAVGDDLLALRGS